MCFLSFPIEKPRPEVKHFFEVLFEHKEPKKAVFIEYPVNEPVQKHMLEELPGREWVPWGPDREQQARYLDNYIEFFYRLGYDIWPHGREG